ncbi:MAG: saccharopine dehydrogenase C-terminal domain-containing protein [Gemmatimonadota bacterium]|nr:saccharopine dehydrogenase C-terminal domain-containing protein [Gemmatimonadota bacterium]MDP6802893.1 saccharopine dehydrogenase C-terminal domain-containing protein [Gemmatimonadota bacterium]MDP7031437.1 saccharopine dehydrogenase C-terminal domain-containing protein [Gemmatimonadota bacterium]
MSRVVIFGSGRVARPAVRLLLERGQDVTIATDQPEAGALLVGGHPNGRVLAIDARQEDEVLPAVRDSDIAVSLLPVSLHERIAEACVSERRPFVTTSYVSPQMGGLDDAARQHGVLLLNECGADPGIDHMVAMEMIDRIHEAGGRVTGFWSVCGGIPSPESNTNPMGYKLSWSPRGVVMAGMRRARYMEDGHMIHVEPYHAYDVPRTIAVGDVGVLEHYPNGDSMKYLGTYGLSDLNNMYRGSFRWPGWCETWRAMSRIGLLDNAPDTALAKLSFAEALRRATGARDGVGPGQAAAEALSLPPDHEILQRFEWLGLFSEDRIPEWVESGVDLLTVRMEKTMHYAEDETDMLVLHHAIDFVDADGREGRGTATLHETGIPGGDSAMARTVALPAGFAVLRILDGTIHATGVRVPVEKSIYAPLLEDLTTSGIVAKQEWTGDAS